MEKLYLTLIVFCLTTSLAYSFMCYKCTPKKADEDYTTEQCEKDQEKVNCTGDDYTCFKLHGESTGGVVAESRGCTTKTICELMKKTCGDDDLKKKDKIKECQAACCVSDGDTPCNSGVTFSTDMILTIFAVLCCSFKLF